MVGKKIVKNQLAYWFPVYVWAVLIFYFSSGSLTATTSIIGRAVFTVSDYYKHMFGYGFLTFLLWRAFHDSKFRLPCVSAVIITFLYGGFNEVYQYFVPGRNPSLFDAFSNLIGCVLVQPLIIAYKKAQVVRKRKG